MPNVRPCKICELGDEVCTEVARMFAIGLPASDVVAYLGDLGHKVTQRQLVDHRRHVVSPKSPRLTATPSGSQKQERVSADILPSGEPGLTDLEREERLILAFLAATDNMLLSLEQTGSIKISRAATELGTLAHNMLKLRMERAEQPDPVISVVVSTTRLEDIL
jgi:hypothetical protein